MRTRMGIPRSRFSIMTNGKILDDVRERERERKKKQEAIDNNLLH